MSNSTEDDYLVDYYTNNYEESQEALDSNENKNNTRKHTKSNDEDLRPKTEEEFLSTVTNPMNKLLTKRDVERILNKVIKVDSVPREELKGLFGGRLDDEELDNLVKKMFGFMGNNRKVKVNNLDKYRQAFVHRSFFRPSKEKGGDEISALPIVQDEDGRESYKPEQSNERLEFLGDTFIKSSIAHYLYFKFSKEDEGFMTQIKSKIESKKGLPEFAKYLKFRQFLILSGHVERLTNTGRDRGRNNPRFLEDSFEAFCGSIVEDFGLVAGQCVVYLFMRGLIEERISFSDLILVNNNFKDILLRYFQYQNKTVQDDDDRWGQPKYVDLYYEGSSHERRFVVCTVLGTRFVDKFPRNTQEKVRKAKLRYLKLMSNAGEEGKSGIETLKKLIKGGYNIPGMKQDTSSQTIIGLGIDKVKIDAGQKASGEALKNLNAENFK